MPSSNAPRDPRREERPTREPDAASGALGLEGDWRAVMERELSAALGSFAAGVAHEARNQIFAVTATLDAFEARFPDAAERPPHFNVMRDDLQRLTTLMRDLAEFGHPRAPVLAYGHVGGAVSDAGGEDIDSIQLITSGTVRVMSDDVIVGTLYAGEYTDLAAYECYTNVVAYAIDEVRTTVVKKSQHKELTEHFSNTQKGQTGMPKATAATSLFE